MKYLKLYEKFQKLLENDKVKLLEFIRFIVEAKGTGFPILIIDDNIDGFTKKIRYITGNIICFEGGVIYDLEQLYLEKLRNLYDYLRKKYPEMVVGREWGFFDLENTK